MAPQKFEFTDMSDSQTNLTNGGGKKDRGLYISPAVGLILVLLAAVVAVGVGIIVHFAGGNRDVVCQCQPSDVPAKPSAEAIKEGCLELAAQGDVDVCLKCTETPSTSRYTTSQGPISTPATTEKPKVTDVRLPTSIVPTHYDVTLHPNMDDPDPENFFFTGTVKIGMRCESVTDNITLHINNLTITEHSLALAGASSSTDPPRITRLEYDTDRQFLIVRLNTNLTRYQSYDLQLTFSSKLKNDLHGLYYSQYTRNGNPVYLATTQFQPTDARKAFPCFDEPAIKATFSTTLIRPTNRISISNMPIVSSSEFVENGKTYVRDKYQITPKMSTYLLAFIVCDFGYQQNVTKNNVTYRAYATPESVDQTPYSLQVGVDIIEYFEDYFQVKYPLPKQDMIAIPDFAAGAMENWGLITYRETSMLIKPGVSNEANRERVAIVVSHELAHQWFGNLVTPSWWDDLWLNEGFASFVEYLGVDYVHPEWRMFEKFVISDLQSSFNFDGLTSSHPVYVPVQHPDEINEIFDTISYAKGATIIRMMRHFLGSETFQKGITNYLKTHDYSNAFHDDLWNALTLQAVAENKSHIDVKAIMDTWVLQMNYPVVTVTLHYGDTQQLEVTQERYLSDPAANDSLKYVSPFGYRWTIPLTFTSSINPRFNHSDTDVFWMLRTEPTKIINVSSSTQLPVNNTINNWILANVQQYGYYRVNYQVNNWLALAKQLEVNHLVIPIINRAQIINDAWNLAKSGHIGLDTALATIEYLGLERDYVPWYAARSELNYVESMLSSSPVYGQFQTFMRSTLNGSFYDFGLTVIRPEHVDVATQALIASQACFYGIQACLDQVSAQFAQWMADKTNNRIDPNLKQTVYCYAISSGGWREWNFTLQMYSEADVASEKSSLLAALSCSKQPEILNYFMELTLPDNSTIRKQDAPGVISNVAWNNVGKSLAWDFFRGNYALLKDKFASSFFGWSSIIESLTDSFNTQSQLNEVKAFMESQTGNLGTGERAFNQALEKVSSNIKWMNKNLQIITDWLDNKQPITG